jgi:sulfur-oxidizing protein SoxA
MLASTATCALVAAFAIAAGSSALTADTPLDERRSTYEQMSAETKAMQDDDTLNPSMLWVLEGEALWTSGLAGRACGDCHGDARQSMRGVAARYPSYDAQHGAVDLEGRINLCRVEHQKASALPYESKELLALSAFIARQSRGMPIESGDARLESLITTGRAIFERRQGQLNIACAQCHEGNWGHKLAGITIPQAHPTGYPIYRLEWQTLGSLQRRLRNCLIGMRAEPYAYGAPEYLALEAFLMWRARGMLIESPGVRP